MYVKTVWSWIAVFIIGMLAGVSLADDELQEKKVTVKVPESNPAYIIYAEEPYVRQRLLPEGCEAGIIITGEKSKPPITIQATESEVKAGYNLLQTPTDYTWGEWTTWLGVAALAIGSQTEWYGIEDSSDSGHAHSTGEGQNFTCIADNGGSADCNFQGSGSNGSGQQSGQESLSGATAGGTGSN